MEPNEFGAWRRKLGLTQQEVAERLGVSRGTVIDYERGRWRSGGEAKIPKAVELACQALEWGATAYGGGVDLLHRGAERPYAQWVFQETQCSDAELERKARELFPNEWSYYHYVVICPEKFDDPATAHDLKQAASEAGIDFEYKFLPISKNEIKGWKIHLICAVFKNMSDAVGFKLMFY